MLDGMPAPLYACTPTRLLVWQGCPRRYRLTYLDRPTPAKGPAWAHTSLGAAAHLALARWFALPPDRRTAQRGVELVHGCWLRDGFRDEAQSATARERVARWVRDYLGEHLRTVGPRDEPAGVERVVTCRTRTLVVSGRADRIDVRQGRLVVVDYKTGRRTPTAQDARESLPLALYAVAAARTLRRPSGRVELHHLPSGTVAAADHDEESLTRAVHEAQALAAQASRADDGYRRGRTGDADFPARASAACTWCDVRRHCPEGRAASVEAPPWAGLEHPAPEQPLEQPLELEDP